MKRFEFILKMRLVLAVLRDLVHDDSVRYNSALYGLLVTAMCCVHNALDHSGEFVEDD